MKNTGLFWWIDRWRKSSAFMDMTLEEQAAYRNLLDEAHLRGGPLPNDERILAKACGDALAWGRVGPAVMARFTLQRDGWHNETLDEIYAKSAELSSERALAGRLGGIKSGESKRKAKEVAKEKQNTEAPTMTDVANGVAKGVAKSKSPSPSPSPDIISGPVSALVSASVSEQDRKGSGPFKAGANGHSKNGTPQKTATRLLAEAAAAKIIADEKVRRRATRFR